MTKLYSYVVASDTGLAPNPFHSFCTLALCKPQVRKAAEVGDWVIGTGSKRNGRDGFLVYAMRVTEILTFNEYWRDDRFLGKRPNANGRPEYKCGDNFCYFDWTSGEWRYQDDIYDCGPNISHETKVNRVLVSDDFVYFGGEGPPIPEFRGVNVCKVGPAHKCAFPDVVVEDVVEWIRNLGYKGRCGTPLNVSGWV